MKDAEVLNYIEEEGREVPVQELTKQKREQAAVVLSDRLMKTAGFRRKNGS